MIGSESEDLESKQSSCQLGCDVRLNIHLQALYLDKAVFVKKNYIEAELNASSCSYAPGVHVSE